MNLNWEHRGSIARQMIVVPIPMLCREESVEIENATTPVVADIRSLATQECSQPSVRKDREEESDIFEGTSYRGQMKISSGHIREVLEMDEPGMSSTDIGRKILACFSELFTHFKSDLTYFITESFITVHFTNSKDNRH
jgi:hypothetical protein